MFSPAEYLTNLNQISLLNGLVIPFKPIGPSIPVVATVPPGAEQCNDVISFLAASPIGLKTAAIIGAAIILTYLIKKYGRTILTSLQSRIKDIVLAIQQKINRQRTVQLLPVSQTVVMGWWFTEPRRISFTKAMPNSHAPNSSGLCGARYGWSLASSMTVAQSSWYSWVLTRFISSRAGGLSSHGKSLPLSSVSLNYLRRYDTISRTVSNLFLS